MIVKWAFYASWWILRRKGVFGPLLNVLYSIDVKQESATSDLFTLPAYTKYILLLFVKHLKFYE